MSFDTIEYRYSLRIMNGFVQPVNGSTNSEQPWTADTHELLRRKNTNLNRISTRVPIGTAMSIIPNSRVVDLRYNRIYTDATQVTNFDWSLFRDNLVFQFPAVQLGEAYGHGSDYHEIITELGL